MDMDIFDTNVLVGIVPNLMTSQNWLLDTFFPGLVESDSEFLSVDVDVGKRRMSPFVSPLVEGKLVEARRVTNNQFKPAYIKDKRAPDLLRPVRRQIGERIGGNLTGAERMMANLTFEMADQIDMLNRRLEWCAAQNLQYGSVTIAGDGYPTTVVNFGRSSSLTIALSGDLTWDNTPATATPGQNLVDWAALVLRESGAVVTDVVFTNTPYGYFKKDPAVIGSVWYPRAGESKVEFGGDMAKGAVYMGNWGAFRLWLYNDWYVDDTNTEQPMIPDGTVILSGKALQGTRMFGAILDPEFSYRAMAYAPKSWTVKDPAQRFVMIQSAPIVVPQRVNASLCATVCDGVTD
jgi:hypothetical protein